MHYHHNLQICKTAAVQILDPPAPLSYGPALSEDLVALFDNIQISIDSYKLAFLISKRPSLSKFHKKLNVNLLYDHTILFFHGKSTPGLHCLKCTTILVEPLTLDLSLFKMAKLCCTMWLFQSKRYLSNLVLSGEKSQFKNFSHSNNL